MKTVLIAAALLVLAGCDCTANGNRNGWGNPRNPHHNVPDNGSTIALLALGLATIATLKRIRK